MIIVIHKRYMKPIATYDDRPIIEYKGEYLGYRFLDGVWYNMDFYCLSYDKEHLKRKEIKRKIKKLNDELEKLGAGNDD